MERMTSRNEDCVLVNGHDLYLLMPHEIAKMAERLATYEDTGLTPEDIKSALTATAVINLAAQALGMKPERLRELAEADKDGRIVVLPCRLGDTAWYVDTLDSPRIMHGNVDGVMFSSTARTFTVALVFEGTCFAGTLGKTVFLTCEEAEKALAEMKGESER